MLGRRYHSTESSLGLSGTAVMSVVSRRIPTRIPMVATLFRVTWESTIAARLVTAAAAKKAPNKSSVTCPMDAPKGISRVKSAETPKPSSP